MGNISLNRGSWIVITLIPIIFSIGLVPALAFAQVETLRGIDLSERDFSCRTGQTLVFHFTRNNYICTADDTAKRWVQLQMAEIVTISPDEPEEQLRAPERPPMPFGAVPNAVR